MRGEPHISQQKMICVPLSSSVRDAIDILSQLDPKKELVEVRVDLLDNPDQLEEVFQKAAELKILTIATVREIKSDPGFSRTRLEFLKRCLRAKSTYADVEIEAPREYMTEAIEEAKKHGVQVIVSHHNFLETEDSSENLDSIVKDCFLKGADIAKIAVTVVSQQGAARVLSLYNTKDKIVALGMGEYGKITRVAALFLGAPFSFAAWDERTATAPGQLTRDRMRAVLAQIGDSNDDDEAKRKRQRL